MPTLPTLPALPTVPTGPVRIATIRGIDVRMAPSWLLVAAAIAWGFHRTFTGDGRSLLLTATMALVAAVLFTGSVLLHEVAHALEGTHRGVEVAGITLFLLGGATALRDPDRRAVDEFAIAAVGPWSNVVLAAGFGLLSLYAGRWEFAAVADVAGLLGWLNLGLAVFNLVPGSPLDGGRVLRAAVWRVTGDRNRATVVAAWVGMLLGALLVGLALWLAAARGAVWAALWVTLIGAYVLRAARLELVRGRLALWLAARTAGELAPPLPPASAAGLVEDAPYQLPTVAHDDPGDRLMGLLDRDQPLVLVRGETETWVSSLHLIDRRIRDLRGTGVPSRPGPT